MFPLHLHTKQRQKIIIQKKEKYSFFILFVCLLYIKMLESIVLFALDVVTGPYIHCIAPSTSFGRERQPSLHRPSSEGVTSSSCSSPLPKSSLFFSRDRDPYMMSTGAKNCSCISCRCRCSALSPGVRIPLEERSVKGKEARGAAAKAARNGNFSSFSSSFDAYASSSSSSSHLDESKGMKAKKTVGIPEEGKKNSDEEEKDEEGTPSCRGERSHHISSTKEKGMHEMMARTTSSSCSPAHLLHLSSPHSPLPSSGCSDGHLLPLHSRLSSSVSASNSSMESSPPLPPASTFTLTATETVQEDQHLMQMNGRNTRNEPPIAATVAGYLSQDPCFICFRSCTNVASGSRVLPSASLSNSPVSPLPPLALSSFPLPAPVEEISEKSSNIVKNDEDEDNLRHHSHEHHSSGSTSNSICRVVLGKDCKEGNSAVPIGERNEAKMREHDAGPRHHESTNEAKMREDNGLTATTRGGIALEVEKEKGAAPFFPTGSASDSSGGVPNRGVRHFPHLHGGVEPHLVHGALDDASLPPHPRSSSLSSSSSSLLLFLSSSTATTTSTSSSSSLFCASTQDEDDDSSEEGEEEEGGHGYLNYRSHSVYPPLGRLGDLFIPRHEYCRRLLWRYEADSGELFLFYPEEISGPEYSRQTLRYSICFHFRLGLPSSATTTTTATRGEEMASGMHVDEDGVRGGENEVCDTWPFPSCSSLFNRSGASPPTHHGRGRGWRTYAGSLETVKPSIIQDILQPYGVILTRVASELRNAEERYHYMHRQLTLERFCTVPLPQEGGGGGGSTRKSGRSGEVGGGEGALMGSSFLSPAKYVAEKKHHRLTHNYPKKNEVNSSSTNNNSSRMKCKDTKRSKGRMLEVATTLPETFLLNSFVSPHTPHQWTPLPVLFDILYHNLTGRESGLCHFDMCNVDDDDGGGAGGVDGMRIFEYERAREWSKEHELKTDDEDENPHNGEELEEEEEEEDEWYCPPLPHIPLAFAISSEAIPISQHVGFHVGHFTPRLAVSPPSPRDVVCGDCASSQWRLNDPLHDARPTRADYHRSPTLPHHDPSGGSSSSLDLSGSAAPRRRVLKRMMSLNDVVLYLVSPDAPCAGADDELEDIVVREVRNLIDGARTVADIIFALAFRTLTTLSEVWRICGEEVDAGRGKRGGKKREQKNHRSSHNFHPSLHYDSHLVQKNIPLKFWRSDGGAPSMAKEELTVLLEIREERDPIPSPDCSYHHHRHRHPGAPLRRLLKEDSAQRENNASCLSGTPKGKRKRELTKKHGEEKTRGKVDSRIELVCVTIPLPSVWESLSLMVEEAILQMEAHHLLRHRPQWNPGETRYRTTPNFQKVLEDADDPDRWELGYYMYWMQHKETILCAAAAAEEEEEGRGKKGMKSSSSRKARHSSETSPISLVAEMVELIPVHERTEHVEEYTEGQSGREGQEEEEEGVEEGKRDLHILGDAHDSIRSTEGHSSCRRRRVMFEEEPSPYIPPGTSSLLDSSFHPKNEENYPFSSSHLPLPSLPLSSLGLCIRPSSLPFSSTSSRSSSFASSSSSSCTPTTTTNSSSRGPDNPTFSCDPTEDECTGIFISSNPHEDEEIKHAHDVTHPHLPTRRASEMMCQAAGGTLSPTSVPPSSIPSPVGLPSSFFSCTVEDTEEEDDEDEELEEELQENTFHGSVTGTATTSTTSNCSRSRSRSNNSSSKNRGGVRSDNVWKRTKKNESLLTTTERPTSTSSTASARCGMHCPHASISFKNPDNDHHGRNDDEEEGHSWCWQQEVDLKPFITPDLGWQVEFAASAALRALTTFYDGVSIRTLQQEMRQITTLQQCFNEWSMPCCQALVEVGLLNDWLEEVKEEEISEFEMKE